MKVILTVLWILTILLCIATGVFKMLQQEADILLFQAIGINVIGTTILGVVQVIAWLLLIPSKTRKAGAIVAILTFILASIAVFANSMLVFGMMSILFILLAASVLYKEKLN